MSTEPCYVISIVCTVERERALRQAAHDTAVEIGAAHDAAGFLDASARSVEECLHLIYDSVQRPAGVVLRDCTVEQG
jgi:hypothetical protein